MKQKTKRIIVGILLAGTAVQGLAADAVFDGSEGSAWTNALNWKSGILPGSADDVFIRDGLTATISSDVGSIQKFYIGDHAATYPPGTGTLTINTGGKLVVNGADPQVGRQTTTNAVGNLNIAGGTLQLGDTTGNLRMFVGLDNANGNPQGKLTISGGTFLGRLLVGSTGITGSSADQLRIEGSHAVIRSTATTGNGLEVRQSGGVEWVFDSAGVSGMDYAGMAGVFNSAVKLVVDMAAYTGGPQTFTLLNCASFNTTPSITVTNAKPGTTYNWNTATGDFTVTTTYSPARVGLFIIQ